MPLAQSVVGYLPDSVLKDLQGGGHQHDTLEVPLEPGKQSSHVRVRRTDIEELRLGPSANGHTSVQIVLKPQANVNFVSASNLGDDLAATLRDPSFIYGLGRLHWFVIMAGPILRQEGNVFKNVQGALNQ